MHRINSGCSEMHKSERQENDDVFCYENICSRLQQNTLKHPHICCIHTQQQIEEKNTHAQTHTAYHTTCMHTSNTQPTE